MSDRIVVVGAGHAAGQLVARLRAEKLTQEVVVIGDEPALPYQRPPLSKDYLAGDIGLDRVLMRAQKFYDDNNILVRSEERVTAVDRAAKQVTLASGDVLDYGHLVLATGTRARTLDLPGAGLDGIFCLRSLADADAIGAALKTVSNVVVVGGGYIGLEVAAVARKAGATVTVLEAMDRLLARTTSETMASRVAEIHTEHGVQLRYQTAVTGFVGDAAVSGVTLGDGSEVPADLVVLGVGVLPNQELAQEAGLDVNDGIVVDARGATADPSIWAVGDCTRHPSRLYGREVRLESVHNAMSQSKIVAANIAGKAQDYDEVPWFWTDQFDFKLQSVGIPDDIDETIVRGSPADNAFTVFLLRNGCVIAAESMNAMRDHMECRKLAGAQTAVDTGKLADPGVPLKEVAL
ncbi:MAG: FAD-dependent oxidoreductase [Pseudomonadota bacterium]